MQGPGPVPLSKIPVASRKGSSEFRASSIAAIGFAVVASEFFMYASAEALHLSAVAAEGNEHEMAGAVRDIAVKTIPGAMMHDYLANP